MSTSSTLAVAAICCVVLQSCEIKKLKDRVDFAEALADDAHQKARRAQEAAETAQSAVEDLEARLP